MNIFSEMIHSLYDFKCYPGFMKQSGKRTFGYGTLLGIFYYILVTLLPIGVMMGEYGGVDGFLKAAIPDFSLSGGTLWVEEPVEIASLEGIGVYLLINTDEPVTEQYTETDLLAFDNAAILDADRMLLKTDGEVTVSTYTEMEVPDMTRDEVIEQYLPLTYAAAAAYLVSTLFSFWLDVLIIALLSNVAAALTKRKQRFGCMVKLAAHAMTVVVLLQGVYAWLPFTIPFFWVISYGLPVFYVWKGLGYVEEKPPVNQWEDWGNE